MNFDHNSLLKKGIEEGKAFALHHYLKTCVFHSMTILKEPPNSRETETVSLL
jgi:hypothetical protein